MAARLERYRATGITTLMAKLDGSGADRLATLGELLDLVAGVGT